MYAEGHKIDRRAAYFEAPLTKATTEYGEQLRSAHPDVFTSLFRFDTPKVPPGLVDGTEEIASRIVMLKSLWPRLLEHYETPLDWYQRWIGWIEDYNAKHRPATALPFHGEIEDMITFIGEELVRLDLADSPLAALLQYERDKVQASRELTNYPGRELRVEARLDEELTPDTVLTRGCAYLIRPMAYELSSLLTGSESHRVSNRSVVMAKLEGEDLTTLQVGERTARILTRVSRPRRIRELAKTGAEPADEAALEETVRLARALIHRGLLVRVDHRAQEEGGTRPGSRGEHELQERFNHVARAYAFYDNQMLDNLNPMMREYIARQPLFFLSTSDSRGNCDCSLRAGEPGVMRVIDEHTVIYPEYRGNGVMASLGNMMENAHVGVFFGDFHNTTIGLHVNGRAELVTHEEIVAWLTGRTNLPGRDELLVDVAREGERRLEVWVRIEVEEAYIHCSKHIPLMKPVDKTVSWGTDDRDYKGGDYFRARYKRTSNRPPTPTVRRSSGSGAYPSAAPQRAPRVARPAALSGPPPSRLQLPIVGQPSQDDSCG